MLNIIQEMKEGEKARPGLAQKFDKAKENLLRETKNFRLDPPYETASYMSRMMIEDNVWHVNNYMLEMEGEYAEKNPLTMEECAVATEDSFNERLTAELLCMGNIKEEGALDVARLIQKSFLQSRPLEHEEIPKLRSLKMPTREEASRIFGDEPTDTKIPLVLEEVAYSESEENHAVHLVLQAGSEHEIGYNGIAILELIGHIAYTSAYNQLRTKEQLGYIVSAFKQRTSGSAHGLSVIVQSSTTLPSALEERCEAWMITFRKDLEEMSADSIAMEAAGVVARLLERNMRLSDEVSTAWGEIASSRNLGSNYRNPDFQRRQKISEFLTVSDSDDKAIDNSKTANELKQEVLAFWDKYFFVDAPERRAISVRVYGHKGKDNFEKNIGKPRILSTYDEVRQLKQFLSVWPTAPYWINRGTK